MTNKFTKFLVGAVIAAAVFTVSASAAYMHTTTLKFGMRSAQVTSLQTTLGVTPATGYFGNLTKTAVMNFQSANGLVADGVVGPATGAKLAGTTTTTTTTTTSGCAVGQMFNPMTGASCSSTTTTTTTGLSGGAGSIDITSTSSGVESVVGEGKTEKVFAKKIEAQDSDIALTNIKLVLSATDTNSGAASENLTKYVDTVSVWLGDKKVGEADASDFSKDSGETPDTYTKSIALSGAVIKEDDRVNLYVGIEAKSTIDSEDIDNAEWTVDVDTVRYTDTTGAILTEDSVGTDTFTFEDSSDSDSLEVKSSSSNPDDSTVKVSETSTSDDFLALAAKLDVDQDSADVDITNLDLSVRLQNAATDSAEDVIDSVVVKVGSKSYDADFESEGSVDSDFNALYSVDTDGLTVDSGDVEDIKIYVTFKKQGNNEEFFANGTIVTVSLTGIDAETENDEVSASGLSKTGADLTLNTSVASLSSISWDVPSKGTLIDFIFTVSAEDDDVDVLLASITANDTVSGNATVATPTLTKVSGDATSISGGYTVADGDSAKFRVRYAVSGTDGQYANVTIESVAGQEVPDEKQLSPTATLDIN